MGKRFSPLNRGGAVPASGKAGTAAVGTWLGRLGQAALGTGRMKMGLMLQQQRFNQRKSLFEADNAEWDRRRAATNEDIAARIEKGQALRREDPTLRSFTPEGGQTWDPDPEHAKAVAEARNVRKTKSTKPRQAPQGPTQQIIALRKSHEAGDGNVMSHKDAMSHRGYATAFNTHIAAGGTEKNFLDNYTPMGYKSRRQNPGENRNDNFNGGSN